MSALEGRAVKLGPPEHFRWLALRRVNVGGVARCRDGWLHPAHPLGLLLSEFLEVLLAEGLIEVGDPSPQDDLSRVRLTDTGRARYTQLCRQQRRPADPGRAAR